MAEMPERIRAYSWRDGDEAPHGVWDIEQENREDATEYVLASTHTRAMEALREAREVIDAFCGYGCPVCHGDCASANPPVSLCPMQQAGAALSRIDAILKEDTAHD